MEEKELKVILQSVLKYEDKNEKGVYKSRLGYILANKDAIQCTDKFKGFSELSYFSNDTQLFDSLNSSHMGQSATLVFTKVQNPRNPLRDSMKLKSIVLKDETISVL